MKIQIEIDVFDDPEYCNRQPGGKYMQVCQNLIVAGCVYDCHIFSGKEFLKTTGSNCSEMIYKRTQCKEAYQKQQS